MIDSDRLTAVADSGYKTTTLSRVALPTALAHFNETRFVADG